MNYFRYKQFNKDVTVAVGYYLRYALSYRDISEILRERGVSSSFNGLPLGSRICPNFISNLEEKA